MADGSKGDTTQLYSPGHFYSPIPGREEIKRATDAMLQPDDLLGIDTCDDDQMALLERLKVFYGEVPFPVAADGNYRFAFDNPSYSWCDAIILFCMIRELRPQRIIEVGSGYTSALMLDVNERYFDSEIDCTFIEPYPDVLLSLLRPQEARRVSIIPAKLQEVEEGVFSTLMCGDILFIDSSHVVKAGSDLQALFFRILPRLRRGVVIHFHDIFNRFEYPADWLEKGIGWNEQYMLRAFLQFNTAFRIKLFTGRVIHHYPEWFAASMPNCLRNAGGNFWIERTDEVNAFSSAASGISTAKVPAKLHFHCNICGEPNDVALAELERENPTCSTCGSNARHRSVIRALSTELFRGESEALPDFPIWKQMTGYGLQDWQGYAARLTDTFSYINTFPDRAPTLDLASDIPSEWIGSADFVIASEVLEHIPSPVQRAFDNILKLLRPGGVLILTVPYSLATETDEHYPELYRYVVLEEDGERVIRNVTAAGAVQEFRSPVFHDGAVPQLEMRVFSESALITQLSHCGFTNIRVHRKPDIVHGVWWPERWSFAMSARRPAL